VSFDGFSSGATSGPAVGAGGSAGGGGADPGGGGGAGTNDLDAGDDKAIDAPVDMGIPLPMPTLVYSAPALASIRGIAVDASNLYWVEGGAGRGVFRMSKQMGGSVVQMRITPNAFDVAVDATSIYWSEGANSFLVYQMPLAGGVLTQATSYFPHNSASPRYIAIDDGAIVYVTTDTGSILSGGAGTSAHPYAAQNGIAGIAFHGVADAGIHDLLWGYGAGIRSGPANGAGQEMDLYTGSTDPVQGVASDGEDMFWVSNNQSIKKGGISMAAAGDAGCIALQASGDSRETLGDFADIAVDDRWIYFTWPSKNQIYKCLK
jgi:hypothetical protein